MEGSFDHGWMIGKVFGTTTGAAVSASPLSFHTDDHSMSEKERKRWKSLALRIRFDSSRA